MSADKSDSQRTAAQYIAYLLVRIQLCATFPYVISHHERELTSQCRALILITLVKLVGHQSRHRVYRLDENLLRFLLDSIRIAFVLYQVFSLDAGFDSQSRHIQRSERKITTSQRRLFSRHILKYTCAATHRSQFVDITFRVVRFPFLIRIERRVEEHEVREQRFCGCLAGFQQQVEVGSFVTVVHGLFYILRFHSLFKILFRVRHPVLHLENLNGENGHFTSCAQSLDCGFQ